MSFTLSERFYDRWTASPASMKQAIHDELDDIIRLLQDETRLDGFGFQNPDLHNQLHHLQTAHLETQKQMAQKLRAERADALLPVLEAKIAQKLNDTINERLAGLDDELKLWIRQIIADELAKEVMTA